MCNIKRILVNLKCLWKKMGYVLWDVILMACLRMVII